MRLTSIFCLVVTFVVVATSQTIPTATGSEFDHKILRSAAEIQHRVSPEYPWEAYRAGLTADVDVNILVGTDGKPEKATIAGVTAPEVEERFRNPSIRYSRIWDSAAIAAALSFRFFPAESLAGKPVKSWTLVSIPFRITESTKTVR